MAGAYQSISYSLTEGLHDVIGMGDVNLGIKWNFHKESKGSHLPAFGASLYFEFPTADASQQLGSGLTDYWLNFIAQKHIFEKTRITGNGGVVFAGNTSTGVLGIQTTRGRVYAGGVSVLRDFSARWTLGAEVYGAFSKNEDLGRSQFQILAGGKYQIHNGMTFDFGLLGGKYAASPRICGQIGFSIDFPAVLR